MEPTINNEDKLINEWIFNDEEMHELWLIEDIDISEKKEEEEFIWNKVITKNPWNDGEDNFFEEEYFEN